MNTGSVMVSPVTGTHYVLEEQLGSGGFGVVFRCTTGGGDEPLCIKLTMDQASWHREAYLAELLQGHARVVTVHETFPFHGPDGMTYAVVMELADRGTLADVLAGSGPFPERRAISEIRGLLTAVDRLHRSGAFHRDITPFNVFMCGRRLKLGDFGISRHAFGKKGLPADAFNPWFVDPVILSGSKSRWTAGDDLWQVGQLLVGMLTGEIDPITARDIRKLDASDLLKSVLYRALGDPGARFADAATMATALRGSDVGFGRARSLKGAGVAFTGGLSIARADAIHLAKKAGAVVHASVSTKVDLIVVGGTSPIWVAGREGGAKLLTAARLREDGHKITLINESTFLKLVGATK